MEGYEELEINLAIEGDDQSSSDDNGFNEIVSISAVATTRKAKQSRMRMVWTENCKKWIQEGTFQNFFRMSYQSFSVLVNLWVPVLKIDERTSLAGGVGACPVLAQHIVHIVIRHLAGGSASDIRNCGK